MEQIELIEPGMKYADNINGSVYEKTIDVDDREKKRYWITVNN